MADHPCIDCAALPPEDRPKRPRKTTGGPRSQRCRIHKSAMIAASSKASHEKRVQKVYNLPPGEYDRLYAAQGGRCWFPGCRATGKARRLTVDHNHDTGEVRGLICKGHNYYLLGWYKNDLEAALAYLADPPYRRFKEGRPLH